MVDYNPRVIEEKWQSRWAESGLYRADLSSSKPKWYFLLMFPYPSGPLHCGHWFAYGPPDTKARYLRMRGYEVLFPMGFDSFGLPAENAAIERGIHPRIWTEKNIGQMRDSFRSMGGSFDPDRWIQTSSPEYYRWTQWLFLQMYKHDLAYRSFTSVDWCPGCNTTLAREQVVGDDRVCDRCSTPVTKRDLNQWSFRITRYAEELLDFEGLDWPDRVKAMQTHWVGKSVGADIHFPSDHPEVSAIEVFTTRPDTVCGATFVVLAPEHTALAALTTDEHRPAVEAYVEQAKRTTEIQRLALNKEKTGVFTGSYVRNPLTDESVPVYVGDYVVVQYGAGAVMGVPAHDQRDFEFAHKYELPVRVVVTPADGNMELETAYTGPGLLRSSGSFDGLSNQDAKKAIGDWLAERNLGQSVVRYRLRDWGVSRQRYWGAPIPIIHCPACGIVPVPESELPVRLPEDVEFRPTGESPLKSDPDFRNVPCPKCEGPAERDTDTMDTFVDSSWYWYRYLAPFETEAFSDRANQDTWLPVAEYGGGIEHATMHMLYARFMAKALRDMGHVRDGEPFRRHVNQGLILGTDNEKMSKSRGNVVDPNAVVDRYGSDVMRSFVMFLGPWGRGGTWSNEGITGLERFYSKVWRLVTDPSGTDEVPPTDADVAEMDRRVHQTIRKVGSDIETFAFNTAISTLMELVNHLTKCKSTGVAHTSHWQDTMRTLILLLAPFAPHITEEMWELHGETESVHKQSWPECDESLTKEDSFTLVVQVNGKIRERFDVPVSITEEEAREKAMASESVQRSLDGKTIVRVIYVPKRLLNIVVK